MANYLVTGGGGFIGRHLATRLAQAGHRVRVLDDLSTGRVDGLEADLVVADAREAASVEAALTGISGCFHLAAVASVARCNQAWSDSHRTNVGATVTLLELAARAGLPVVYASSAAIYGGNQNLPLVETALPAPSGAYGVDKLACEWHAGIGASVHGMRSVGLRFFNVYGVGQRPDSPYSGVVSIFADRIARGLPITLHGDGVQSRDLVHVDDVVAALEAAMRLAEGAAEPMAEIVNVCTGRATSIRELAMLLMRLERREVELDEGPARAADVRHSRGCPSRMKSMLGVEAQVALEDGLVSLVG